MSQSSGSSGSSNPNTPSQPSPPAAASKPNTPSQSASASVSQPHPLPIPKRDKVDHSTKFTVIVSSIVAVISSLITAAATVWVGRPELTPMPTLAPTATLAPAPGSPEGVALNEYLLALEKKDFKSASEFISNYSLLYLGKKRDDIIPDIQIEQEKIEMEKGALYSHEILVPSEIIEINKKVLFRVIARMKDVNGKIISDIRQYTLYKDDNDGIFRVNFGRLIDYREVLGKELQDPSKTISIKPIVAAHIAEGEKRQLQVRFDVKPPADVRIDYPPIPLDGPGIPRATCEFPDGISRNVNDISENNGRITLIFEDTYEQYPTFCRIYELTVGEKQWSQPSIEIMYR